MGRGGTRRGWGTFHEKRRNQEGVGALSGKGTGAEEGAS